jgi:hypothetical protein
MVSGVGVSRVGAFWLMQSGIVMGHLCLIGINGSHTTLSGFSLKPSVDF